MSSKSPEKARAIAAGSDRYFTGKPCRKGHIAERTTGSSACMECLRDTDRRFKNKHKERLRQKRRKHVFKSCALCGLEFELRTGDQSYCSKSCSVIGSAQIARAYVVTRRSRTNELQRKRYWADPDKFRERAAKNYKPSRDTLAKKREWYYATRDKNLKKQRERQIQYRAAFIALKSITPSEQLANNNNEKTEVRCEKQRIRARRYDCSEKGRARKQAWSAVNYARLLRQANERNLRYRVAFELLQSLTEEKK